MISYSDTPEQPQGCTLNFIDEMTGETVSIAFGYLHGMPTAMLLLVSDAPGEDRLVAVPREVLSLALDHGWEEVS